MKHFGVILSWTLTFALFHGCTSDSSTYDYDNYSGFVDFVTIDAGASGTLNGMPACYKDEPFNLSVYLHLNETWSRGVAAHLTLYVNIPNDNHQRGRECHELTDGVEFDCTTYADIIEDHYFNIDENLVSTYIADNIHVDHDPIIHPVANGHLEIDFGLVYLLPVITTTPSAMDLYTSG